MWRDSKMETPLISVIMPAYNRQATIAYSIESVLNQSYKNFELILVDDASDDATYEIMDFYSRVDNRVKVTRNTTNSRSSLIEWEPRNDGLKLAKGSLISYLDSDNLWSPDFLKICARSFDNPEIQLVHCNSRNHYKDDGQYRLVLEKDQRALVAANDEDLTTVYSYAETDDEEAGLSWYIDTNEMMHRASAFRDLTSLWATRHPNRVNINQSQLVRCTYRRHNDQELAERIIAQYGIKSLKKYDDVLVDFFYAPRQKNFLKLQYEQKVIDIIKRYAGDFDASLSWENQDLNIDFFYTNHLSRGGGNSGKIFDFGVGELIGNFSSLSMKAFEEYAALNTSSSRLIKYGGTASLKQSLQNIASAYAACGLVGLNEFSITPCDGGHNALFHSLQAISKLKSDSFKAESEILFMVPSYPYWSICSAAGYKYRAIEAYNFNDFIDMVSGYEFPVAAIIINTPNNPLGISITLEQVERVNEIARRKGCAIIVDIPYHNFIEGEKGLSVVNSFDERRTIFCDSVSKSLGLPGLRLGFCLTKNKDLGALVRACKSASSLLPSSIKLDFVDFLQRKYPDYALSVAQKVYQTRLSVENHIFKDSLPEGTTVGRGNNFTIYDVLFINKDSPLFRENQQELIDSLYNEHNIIVTSGEKLFPPNFHRNNFSKNLIRLSYGKIDDVEDALNALSNALQELSSLGNLRRKIL